MKKSNLSLLVTVATTVLAIAMFTACAKEELLSPEDNNYPEVVKLSNVDAQTAFAKILSRAVSDSKEVRSFIKTEALAQFDNDYDVFYPFVKDKEVANGKTFRDILLSYCDDEEELIQIEESALLLNILVPDLTLFWDFDAEKWNADDAGIAVISRDDADNTLYENGEVLGSLPSDEIPGFPCLVVKNNERMVVCNNATRAGNAVYEFASDAFDPSKTRSLTRSDDWPMALETAESPIPYAKAAELDPWVITGWEEFGTDYRKAQRDSPYLGITRSNSDGELKINYAEEIFMFKILAGKYSIISDQFGDTDPDPYLNDDLSPGKGNGPAPNDAWIIERIWKGGKFEIRFQSYLAGTNSSQSALTMDVQYSVPAKQAFSMDKVQVYYTNGTLVRRHIYRYKFNSSDLKPKWIRTSELPDAQGGAHVFTKPWNLSNQALVFHMFVSEYDASGTYTATETVQSEVSVTEKNGQTENNEDNQQQSGQDVTNTTTQTNVVQVERTLGSDNLGEIEFDYRDPVILNDTKKNTEGYELFRASNSYVEVVLLPSKRY